MAEIIPYQQAWQNALTALWDECDLARPWHDDNLDVRMHLLAPVAQVWLLVDGETLIGAINIAIHADQTACVYYLAVKPEEAIKGYGKQLMEFAQTQLHELGCVEAMLLVRDRHAKVRIGAF